MLKTKAERKWDQVRSEITNFFVKKFRKNWREIELRDQLKKFKNGFGRLKIKKNGNSLQRFLKQVERTKD